MTASRSVRMVIDRLVLHGVDRADAAAVRRALSSELEATLAGADFGAGKGIANRSLRLDLAPVADSAALGRSAGRALGSALGGAGKKR